ncbi:dihydrolipoamide acetyltransferase family protein [Luethyella okanaganae]|uniref:Dihydrolipoamide acetyltransferase component of pyruvate dehydrogenase complex n=1 Tax=Luethyella okanaganae TaxID=69372 RepID=A0ABW1VIY7_9MICO
MSVIRDFVLPDLGEGLTESEIVTWRVAVGDAVALNQIIADVETAKAIVELPSPFAGTVAKLYAEPGVTVNVGERIVAFEVDDGAVGEAGMDVPAPGEGSADPGASSDSGVSGPSGLAGGEGDTMRAAPAPDAPEPNLVGYGAKDEGTGRPVRRAHAHAASTPVEPRPPSPVEVVETGAIGERLRSTPPVRKLARGLGVDLGTVTGTGADGLITRDDVLAVATGTAGAGALVSTGSTGGDGSAGGDGSTGGDGSAGVARSGSAERETRTPIRSVRKLTAAAMVQSAFTAPHVTEFLTVDVTRTMELLAALKEDRAFSDIHVNILTVVAKAVCVAVTRTPSLNAHWDDAAQEIVQYHYVNLGIAAATPRGLLVPNIKDADALDLAGLVSALAKLTQTARAGKTPPADLEGGTISITNIGVFGIDAGTPILNPGEAGILAMGAVRREPREFRGGIALRDIVTLSLSFDHRLVDGEQGSRFLADVGSILAEPGRVLTMV